MSILCSLIEHEDNKKTVLASTIAAYYFWNNDGICIKFLERNIPHIFSSIELIIEEKILLKNYIINLRWININHKYQFQAMNVSIQTDIFWRWFLLLKHYLIWWWLFWIFNENFSYNMNLIHNSSTKISCIFNFKNVLINLFSNLN
jgi:hypothetical protein